jgi:hypothetical protein
VSEWSDETFSTPIGTPNGEWLTRIVEEYVTPFNENFGRCATLMPNVTLKPGLQQNVIIDLDSGIMDVNYNKSLSW